VKAEKVFENLAVAADALLAIARIAIPAKYEEAAPALSAIKAIFAALAGHADGTVTAEAVRAEAQRCLEEFQKFPQHDKAADDALAKKFEDG
jgi:hypothetical protein